MTCELNDVLVEGAAKTVSVMARQGRLTCLACSVPLVGTRLLLAMLGLEPLKSGYVCLDGEPLEKATVPLFRSLMAYVPATLKPVGEVVVYEPPTVQDVFSLRANRDVAISNGLLVEEMKRTGAPHDKAQLLAVAVLRRCPILLVDQPHPHSAPYLRSLASRGLTVIMASNVEALINAADESVLCI